MESYELSIKVSLMAHIRLRPSQDGFGDDCVSDNEVVINLVWLLENEISLIYYLLIFTVVTWLNRLGVFLYEISISFVAISFSRCCTNLLL